MPFVLPADAVTSIYNSFCLVHVRMHMRCAYVFANNLCLGCSCGLVSANGLGTALPPGYPFPVLGGEGDMLSALRTASIRVRTFFASCRLLSSVSSMHSGASLFVRVKPKLCMLCRMCDLVGAVPISVTLWRPRAATRTASAAPTAAILRCRPRGAAGPRGRRRAKGAGALNRRGPPCRRPSATHRKR